MHNIKYLGCFIQSFGGFLRGKARVGLEELALRVPAHAFGKDKRGVTFAFTVLVPGRYPLASRCRPAFLREIKESGCVYL
jgi:hypothetical protein